MTQEITNIQIFNAIAVLIVMIGLLFVPPALYWMAWKDRDKVTALFATIFAVFIYGLWIAGILDVIQAWNK